MLRKVIYLFIVFSSLLFAGCSGRTVDIQPVSSIEEGKSLFDEFDLSEVYVKFHQDKNGIDYDEVSAVPFPWEEIKALYQKNEKNIKSGLENNGLSDCLKIDRSGRSQQCSYDKENTIFLKNSPHIVENPIKGAIGIALLPLGAAIDILSFDKNASESKGSLVDEVIDKKSMSKYSSFLIYKMSNDLDESKQSFNSYKKFLKDTTLINLSNERMITQLRSFGSKEAYDLAYDLSLLESDLKKAYPTIAEIDAFLANPHQNDLSLGGRSNCSSVSVSALNIRNKPTTKRSKVVGKYVKGDVVCPVDEKKGWVKTSRGWTSKKYLRAQKKANKGNLAVKITKVKKFKRQHDLQASLKSNSIGSYEKYITTYGSDKDVDGRLQALYRSKGKVTKKAVMYKKSYMIAANDDDVTDFIKHSSLASVRKEYLDSSFIKSPSHRKLLKDSLLKRLRTLATFDSFSEAYRYSRDSSDLQEVFKRVDTVDGLESFVSEYKNTSHRGIVSAAEKKLVALYRANDSFTDYLAAYELLSETQDAEKALSKSTTPHEKALVEKAVFERINHKNALVSAGFKGHSASYDDHEISRSGFFSQHSFAGKIYPSGRINVAFRDNIAFRSAFGKYRVTVTVAATVPRTRQVRSKWLGSGDERDDVHQKQKVTLILRPPYSSAESGFNFGEMDFVYFDRGSSGGYTAKWPVDNMYMTVEDISVEYAGEGAGSADNLNIDFEQLSQLQPAATGSREYVEGSYSKGVDVLSRFSNLDDSMINSYRSQNTYASSSSSYSSESSSSSSRSQSSRSSSAKNSGVKEVYDGGYKSSDGHPIYIVRCVQGGEFNAFKKSDGYWFDSSGSNYGSSYRNLTMDQFAQKKCSY